MADLLLLAVSDYPGIPLDRRTVVLAVTLALFLVGLPLLAWWAGALDRRGGRHAAYPRPPMPEWMARRREVAMVWLQRLAEHERELADAREGGGER